MLKISNVKIPVTSTLFELEQILKKQFYPYKINNIKVLKKSIDARKKDEIYYIYTVEFESENESKLLKINKDLSVSHPYKYCFPNGKALSMRPVIIGFGPAGMFAGLVLAQNGYRPIIIERGSCVEERTRAVELFWNTGVFNKNTNVQFGEGGAGTFSDGKLNTGTKDVRIRKVLKEFVKFGASEEILYIAKPHIGTDVLKKVVKNIRNEIIRLGGDIHFNTCVNNILTQDGKIVGVIACKQDKQYEIYSDNVIFAMGHSARDTFKMLKENNVKMQKKPFSIGVRIEHTRNFIDKSQYGEFSKFLGAADYKLYTHLKNKRGVYTFCMCPKSEAKRS